MIQTVQETRQERDPIKGTLEKLGENNITNLDFGVLMLSHE
jgi:hypothetical protein